MNPIKNLFILAFYLCDQSGTGRKPTCNAGEQYILLFKFLASRMKDLQLLLLDVLHTAGLCEALKNCQLLMKLWIKHYSKLLQPWLEVLPCWVASANAQQLQCAQLCGFGTHCYVQSQSYVQIWKHFSQCAGERTEARLLPHHWSEVIGGQLNSFIEINGLISLLHQSESCSLHSPNHFIRVNLCHFGQAKYMACTTSFLMHALPETLGKSCKTRLQLYLRVSSRCFGFPPLLSLMALSISSWIKLAWAEAEAINWMHCWTLEQAIYWMHQGITGRAATTSYSSKFHKTFNFPPVLSSLRLETVANQLR